MRVVGGFTEHFTASELHSGSAMGQLFNRRFLAERAKFPFKDILFWIYGGQSIVQAAFPMSTRALSGQYQATTRLLYTFIRSSVTGSIILASHGFSK